MKQQKINKYSLLMLALMLVFLFPQVQSSAASTYASSEPIPVQGVSQQDLDNDQLPDVTVIDCAFATAHDLVLVYDQYGDMLAGNQWEQVTDFKDDVWVFDAGADGTAQLIVDFNMENGKYIALVYDDINGDRQVNYQLEGKQLKIDESSFWHVKVEADRLWTQPGVLYDTKVTFWIDGYAGLVLFMGINTGNEVVGVDGVADWQLEVADKDGDGINDYQLIHAISSILVDEQVARYPMGIYAQVIGMKPSEYLKTVFWPLLIDIKISGGLYFDHPPAVAINWQSGKIERIGIIGYPIEDGYHILSSLPLEKNTVNPVDWENPMAYYDMADDLDGWPELQVRFQVCVINDPYCLTGEKRGSNEMPNVEVDYSWDEDNDNRWDFKMNLNSNDSIDEVVNFPDFAIKSVPYEEIIPWVRNRDWDVAMLVYDGNPSGDSEGMYAKGWMIDRGYANGGGIEPSGVSSGYMMGFTDRPPVEYYQDIQEFMRGEYCFQYFDTPKIYMSSLDHQIHLQNAQSGVWNLGNENRIRYANLDGDGYLDQWQEENGRSVLQQVNYSDGFYVYSGTNSVILKHTELPPALFEIQPPGSNEEWLRLEVQLKANQMAFLPTDFLGMLAQLSAEQMEIRGATIRDYRPTTGGFRFVVELLPGFAVSGTDWLGVQGQAPGEYAVSYDGTFHLSPLTPPALKISINPDTSTDHPPTQYINQDILVTLENAGLQDAQQVLVSLGTYQMGREITWSTPQTVTVLAGETTSIHFSWTPAADGVWYAQVNADLVEPDVTGSKPDSTYQTMTIQPAHGTDLEKEVSAFGVVSPWQIVLLIVSIMITVGSAGWVLAHSLTQKTNPQQPIARKIELRTK